jgi:hypothetical protein
MFASLDITNIYANIPVTETKQILENMLSSHKTNPQVTAEILKRYDVVTTQNYFTHKEKIILQTDGLAIGAPSSSIIAEIFKQAIEHSHMPLLAQKHLLINYFRYVDDILLIFDSQHTNIHAILNDFNSIHPKLLFTAEIEQNNSINYLQNPLSLIPSSPTPQTTPPQPPQICCSEIHVPQTRLLPTTKSRTQTRIQHHTKHHIQQLLPAIPP